MKNEFLLTSLAIGGMLFGCAPKNGRVDALPTRTPTSAPTPTLLVPTTERIILPERTPIPTRVRTEIPPRREIDRSHLLIAAVGNKRFGYYGNRAAVDLYKNGFSITVANIGGKDTYRTTNGSMAGPIADIKFICANPNFCGYSVTEGAYTFSSPEPLRERYTALTKDTREYATFTGVLTIFFLEQDAAIGETRYLVSRQFLGQSVFTTDAVQVDQAWKIEDGGIARKVGGDIFTVRLVKGRVPGPIAYLYEDYPLDIRWEQSAR